MVFVRAPLLPLVLVCWFATPTPAQTRRRVPPPPAPSATPPKTAPIRGLAEQTQRRELTLTRFSNGLRLICAERHSTELAALAVRLGFGEADEPENQPGVTWVVAHGLLAEAEHAALADFGAIPEIRVEAQATTVTVVAPATHITGVISLVLRALTRADFDEARLRSGSTQAGLDRRKQLFGAKDLSYRAWSLLAAGRRRAGSFSEAHLTDVTLDAARAFHAIHLTPRRTVVAVAGDVNLVEVLRAVADATADWKPASVETMAAAADSPRYQADRGPQGRTWLQLGYVLPPLRQEERLALEVIAAALASGRRARLSEALVENRSIAAAVSAQVEADAQRTALCLSLDVHPERLDRAEALTLEAIERLRRERLSEGELQRAKAQLELERWLEGDSLETWARQLARAEAGPRLMPWLDDLERLDGLTTEQVRAVAAKYLTARRLVVFEYEAATAPLRTFTPEKFFETVGLLVPQTLVANIPADDITDAPETVVVPTKPRPKPKDEGLVVLPPAEPVREYATLRGPRVLVRPDPIRPLLTIGLYFQGGRFIEDEITAGVTELMLRIMTRSSAKYVPYGLLDELERLGGRVQIVNERDFFGFELCVLARQAEAALRRLVTLVERPHFDAAVVQAERERLLAEQKRWMLDPVELATWLARRSLFPSHPYGFPPLGVSGTVGRLDEDVVQRWYATTVQRQLPMIVLVGGTQGSALVTRDITEGFLRRETDTSLRARIAQPATTPSVQEATTGIRDIAALAFATPGGRDADDRWLVLAACLTRRLDAETRQAEDFHFTVRFTPALQHGELLVVGAGRPDSAPRLIDTIERVLERVAKHVPSAAEWRLAKQYAATQTARRIDTVSGRGRAYATATYLGIAPSEVDVMLRSIRQAPAPSEDILASLGSLTAGRGLVRGSRLAQPKAAP